MDKKFISELLDIEKSQITQFIPSPILHNASYIIDTTINKKLKVNYWIYINDEKKITFASNDYEYKKNILEICIRCGFPTTYLKWSKKQKKLVNWLFKIIVGEQYLICMKQQIESIASLVSIGNESYTYKHDDSQIGRVQNFLEYILNAINTVI